jgi:succinoglycan biosynthesis transport protein ExoP
VVAATAYFVSASREKTYEASAVVVVRDPPIDPRQIVGPQTPVALDPKVERATNALLFTSRAVRRGTARRLGVGLERVTVTAKEREETNAVDVVGTAGDPRFAARLANAFAREYISRRRANERAKLRSALRSMQRARARLPAWRKPFFRDREDNLRVLLDVQTAGAEIASRAVTPAAPASPRPRRDALYGAIFGLFLGGALALLREQSDRRVRRVSQLQDFLDLPVLGTIPESRTLAAAGDRRPLPPDDAEAFRLVQANTRYFKTDHPVRSIVVTSADPGDGKTTLAWNLAAAAASGGTRVLLVEADLRQPCIAARYGLSNAVGLSQVLTGRGGLSDVVQHVPVVYRRNGEGPDLGMDVVVAGPEPANPTDLVASERMRDTIEQGERLYDLVVIDTPPVAVISDAIPLLRHVGGVVVVSYLGRTTRERVGRLLEQLRNLDVDVLGVVANGAPRTEQGYRYAYRERV